MIQKIYLKGDQPFLTQREAKTEEFLHDLHKQYPKEQMPNPRPVHTVEEKWQWEKRQVIEKMKQRRYRRWRQERVRYRDNYVVQEGKLLNTGRRWLDLD